MYVLRFITAEMTLHYVQVMGRRGSVVRDVGHWLADFLWPVPHLWGTGHLFSMVDGFTEVSAMGQ